MRVLDRPEPVPVAPWDEFVAMLPWDQGEHVSLIGPTGRGKTTLAVQLLPKRDYVAVIATKPRDPVVARFRSLGYEVVREMPPHVDTAIAPRIVVWPRFRGLADVKAQQRIVHQALARMFADGGWTIYLDEVSYIVNQLKLRSAVELLWQQSRAVNVTLVAGTQRPAFVPLLMYDQATHLFLWRDNDARNIDRLGSLGVDSARIKAAIRRLGQHEALYVNGVTGGMVRVTPPPLD